MSSVPIRNLNLAGAFSQGISSGTQLGRAFAQRQDVRTAQGERRQALKRQQEGQEQATAKEEEIRGLQLLKRGGLGVLALRDDPERFEASQKAFTARLGEEFPSFELPGELLTPDQLTGVLQEVDNQLFRLGVEGAAEPEFIQKARDVVAQEFNNPAFKQPGAVAASGDLDAQARLTELAKASSGIVTEEERLARLAAKKPLVDIGGITVSGAQRIEKRTKVAFEKTALAQEETIESLSEMLSIPDEMFGIGAVTKDAIGGLADFLGVPAGGVVDFTERRQDFMTEAKFTPLNALRQLSGAAVSDQERAAFREIFLHPDKVGPRRFKAATRRLIIMYQRDLDRNRRARGEGLSVTPSGGQTAAPVPQRSALAPQPSAAPPTPVAAPAAAIPPPPPPGAAVSDEQKRVAILLFKDGQLGDPNSAEARAALAELVGR